MAVSRPDESDTDAILPVSIGTGTWIVALVVLLLMRATLDANGTSWWIGVAAVGTVSGLLGLVFLRWRKGRAKRGGAQETSTEETLTQE